MNFAFHKYHGTGNDFIIIDDRDNRFTKHTKNSASLIAGLCHRQFGIGADGLMLLQHSLNSDFHMEYYNADGREGSFCGNGSRCMVAFAHRQGLVQGRKVRFTASDGLHSAELLSFDNTLYQIAVDLSDTHMPEKIKDNEYFVNTGSPHLVLFVKDPESTDASLLGAKIRHDPAWKPEGVNVNFAACIDSHYLQVKTYERGVERETLSCGTGVAAAAIAACVYLGDDGRTNYRIKTEGGELGVSFNPPKHGSILFTNIRLSGPAQFVFCGDIPIK